MRKSAAVDTDPRKTTEATRLGRRKGYFSQNATPPKTLGNWSAGLAKKPPKAGPKMEPSDQTRGMSEKAMGWSDFSGTISATMVLMMPTIWVLATYPTPKHTSHRTVTYRFRYRRPGGRGRR